MLNDATLHGLYMRDGWLSAAAAEKHMKAILAPADLPPQHGAAVDDCLWNILDGECVGRHDGRCRPRCRLH